MDQPEVAKLDDLETILAAVAESCDRLDQRLQSTKDAYEHMNCLAHRQLWSEMDCQPHCGAHLEVHFDATFGRQLLAPSSPTMRGQVLLREAPAIWLPWQVTSDARQDWLKAWRMLSPSQRVQLEDFEAQMDAVQASDRDFRLTEQELLELRSEGMECHLDSLLHFRQVCRVNAQCLGMGAALFTRASKLTHSCRPNCHTVEDGKVLELRTLRDLLPKEALTISYIADEKLLLQDAESRRRYLWTHHCFRCRCGRCEEDLNCGDRGCPDRTAVEQWRRIEGKVGNLLKPQSLEENLQNGSWKQLWYELITWQIESEKVLPEDHWAMVHAALLASYMAMTRYAEGFPLPLRVGRILQGFAKFLRLHQQLCPEVWWLTTDVQAFLRRLPLVLVGHLDESLGSLADVDLLNATDTLNEMD